MSSQVEAIFSAAMACDLDKRETLVEELCGNDQALRAEVSSLLTAADRADDFLQTPVLDSQRQRQPSAVHCSDIDSGRIIGAYRIGEEIGRGGMGVVYRAHRADGQYQREVAVKLLRRDIGTENWEQRFANEKQILANLNHPNIAQLIDGGTTTDGQSYLVMEFVNGEPVNVYCRRNNLSVEQRLELFRKICGAVNFAHRNLVVHRDLKPDNIYVTDSGEPKLLDFGIAKLVSSDEALTSGITGAVPFTPEYAAPEQLDGGIVTTATDIYALGVLLYELLCDRRPFTGISNIAELIESVLKTEVAAPSKHLDGLRQRQIRGDLDAITMKALSKSPADRYDSVNQLVDDVDNYQQGLPVVANRAGVRYRLQKFIKRNAIGVLLAVAVLTVLLSGITATIWQWQIASSERDLSTRRYEELRSIINTMVFDLPARIKNFPGSEDIRAEMMNQGVAWLDTLREQQPDDPRLVKDLAQAYQQMGMLLGSPSRANIGASSEAIASLKSSEVLFLQLLKSNPDDDDTRLDLGKSYVRLMVLLGANGASSSDDLKQAVDYASACAAMSRALMRDATPKIVNQHLSCLTTSSYVTIVDGRFEDAKVLLDEADTVLNRFKLKEKYFQNGDFERLSSRLMEDRAVLAADAGDYQRALELEIDRILVLRKMPDSQANRRMRLIAWAKQALGQRYAALADYDTALASLDDSIASWTEMYKRSDKDIGAAQALSLVLAEKARLLWQISQDSTDDTPTQSLRDSACEHYGRSVDVLNLLPEPRANFPSRYRWSPKPIEIHTEAEQRCSSKA